jgi:hypothetical protein
MSFPKVSTFTGGYSPPVMSRPPGNPIHLMAKLFPSEQLCPVQLYRFCSSTITLAKLWCWPVLMFLRQFCLQSLLSSGEYALHLQ